MLDPDGNAGYVPTQYTTVVSTGIDPAEVERLARDAERLSREAVRTAERDGWPEKIGQAVAWLRDLLSSGAGSPPLRPQPPGPPTGSPPRVAVLLPGINTESSSEFRGVDSASLGQVYDLMKRAPGYDDVIFFGYNCGTARGNGGRVEWSPAAYVYTDTHRQLDTGVAQLNCMLSAYQNAAAGPVSFDLVGHSLGGAIAFRYLAGGGSRVVRLVTLDSPVNGANPHTGEIWNQVEQKYGLFRFLPGVAEADRERIRRSIAMYKSPAANELKAQGADPVAAGKQSFETVQALRKRGVTVRTYTNPRDIVVAQTDAGVSGFSQEFTRGEDLNEIIWLHNIEGWLLSSQDNHLLITQVLDDDPVARAERTALYSDLEVVCR